MAEKRQIRHYSECRVFGEAEDLPDNMLPTLGQVMRYYKFLENRERANNNGRYPTKKLLAKEISSKLMHIWNQAEITILTQQTIINHILRNHKMVQNLKSRFTENAEKIAKIRNVQGEELFDIAKCKCEDVMECNCKHEDSHKAKLFLLDQRTDRKMSIASRNLRKRNHEREQENEQVKKQKMIQQEIDKKETDEELAGDLTKKKQTNNDLGKKRKMIEQEIDKEETDEELTGDLAKKKQTKNKQGKKKQKMNEQEIDRNEVEEERAEYLTDKDED